MSFGGLAKTIMRLEQHGTIYGKKSLNCVSYSWNRNDRYSTKIVFRKCSDDHLIRPGIA